VRQIEHRESDRDRRDPVADNRQRLAGEKQPELALG
jgi:hypothetical protein